MSTTFGYDDDGRTSSQTSDGATTSFGYDPAGRLTETRLPPATGTAEHRDYDRAGRLTSARTDRAGTLYGRWDLTLDQAGEPTQISADRKRFTQTGEMTHSLTGFEYDGAGRLAVECDAAAGHPGCEGNTWSTTFSYDKAGNRSSLVERTPDELDHTTTYTYDAADELTDQSTRYGDGSAGSMTYTYDADGNQLTRSPHNGISAAIVVSEIRSFGYDPANRMTSATSEDGSTAQFGYDATGDLIDNDGTPQTWDPNNPSARLATIGSTPVSYDPLGRVSRAGNYRTHDWAGSVADTFDSTGEWSGSANYSAFGDAFWLVDFAFAGQASLGDGEHLRFPARVYNPADGRFTTRDPAAARTDLPYTSAYSYVDNRPTTFTDPDGRAPVPVVDPTGNDPTTFIDSSELQYGDGIGKHMGNLSPFNLVFRNGCVGNLLREAFDRLLDFFHPIYSLLANGSLRDWVQIGLCTFVGALECLAIGGINMWLKASTGGYQNWGQFKWDLAINLLSYGTATRYAREWAPDHYVSYASKHRAETVYPHRGAGDREKAAIDWGNTLGSWTVNLGHTCLWVAVDSKGLEPLTPEPERTPPSACLVQLP